MAPPPQKRPRVASRSRGRGLEEEEEDFVLCTIPNKEFVYKTTSANLLEWAPEVVDLTDQLKRRMRKHPVLRDLLRRFKEAPRSTEPISLMEKVDKVVVKMGRMLYDVDFVSMTAEGRVRLGWKMYPASIVNIEREEEQEEMAPEAVEERRNGGENEEVVQVEGAVEPQINGVVDFDQEMEMGGEREEEPIDAPGEEEQNGEENEEEEEDENDLARRELQALRDDMEILIIEKEVLEARIQKFEETAKEAEGRQASDARLVKAIEGAFEEHLKKAAEAQRAAQAQQPDIIAQAVADKIRELIPGSNPAAGAAEEEGILEGAPAAAIVEAAGELQVAPQAPIEEAEPIMPAPEVQVEEAPDQAPRDPLQAEEPQGGLRFEVHQQVNEEEQEDGEEIESNGEEDVEEIVLSD
uniref:SPK domain-containing protein n=1 Tax=Caenorhabditis tropicalis TaxID=1561998 RepID=A0A1I7UF20_9PELO